MTSAELKRWLSKQGCIFVAGRGGHLTVYRQVGKQMFRSTLPMHGKKHELGTGLVNRIKKDLALVPAADEQKEAPKQK
jgi:mRNA interferase HicA